MTFSVKPEVRDKSPRHQRTTT